MIDKTHRLPITRQAELLELSRSGVYTAPRPISDADLSLMRRIDALHLAHPFAGMLRGLLAQEGLSVGRRHVTTLMRQMGLTALYRCRNTSRKHPAHPVYPYLLRHLAIERPNHVFAMDITYLPMARGFVYLAAVIDWATRRVLAWRLSNTLTTDFCIAAAEEAIAVYGAPEIFNTDQGSQFTDSDFTDLLKRHGIQISMDGKGCFRDNVFVERLWRTVKYEEIYLHAYTSTAEVQEALTRYFTFYNSRRPHSALDGRTPDQVHFPTQRQAA